MAGISFKPIAPTILANVSNVAASVTVLSNTQPAGAWFITNAGTTDVFFRLSTNASVVATIPVNSGDTQPGQLINAGDSYVIYMPMADGNGSNAFSSNVTVSSVTASGTSQLFITPVQVPFA